MLPTGYERALPPGVQVTVRARRSVLATRARGRVLDLGGADSHQHLWHGNQVTEVISAPELGTPSRDAALDRLINRGERFDTIFSIFQLIGVPSLTRTLDQLKQLLADDGQVLFLEPGRATGVIGGAQRLVALPVAMMAGWQIERDVPARLRSAGLTVTDIERHRSRTVQPWLRWLVEGVARHALFNRDRE